MDQMTLQRNSDEADCNVREGRRWGFKSEDDSEIEDGEIVDSQGENDEADQDEDPEVKSGNPSSSAAAGRNKAVAGGLAGLMQMELENDDPSGSSKKKKKKRKKKKRTASVALNLPPNAANAGSDETGVSKPKKPKKPKKYVDYDRVNDDNNGPWFERSGGLPVPFPHAGNNFGPSNRLPPPSAVNEYDAPPPPPYVNSPKQGSRSPPGLYDSPYESTDEDNKGPHPLGDMGMGPGRFQDNLMSRDGGGPGGKFGKMGCKKRKRQDKRGGGLGGKGRRLNKRLGGRQICKYYLDGKCTKGEECTYSHDTPVPRKAELCKFYLNGFCAKSDTCIYMHQFPCKFFHTGATCYSAERCKFSHETLTEDTRIILDKYLAKEDGLPEPPTCGSPVRQGNRPSLLGSPPRHIKEMVAHEQLKKIPSLFDIEVIPPPMMMPSGPQPIPPPQVPPPQPPNGGPPGFYGDAPPRQPLLPFPKSSSFVPDERDNFHFCDNGPFGAKDGYDNSSRHGFDSGRGHGGGHNMLDVDDRFLPGPNVRGERNNGPVCEFSDKGSCRQKRTPGAKDGHGFHPIPWRKLAVADVDMRATGNVDSEEDGSMAGDANRDGDSLGADRDKSQSSESENEARKSTSASVIQIPAHLPKKQRELFLRIQQQQRQADSSQEDSDKGEAAKKTSAVVSDQDKTTEESATSASGAAAAAVLKQHKDESEDDEKSLKESNGHGWQFQYSSDEDDDDVDKPLAAVLKKLQSQPQQSQAQQPSAPVFNITQLLQNLTGKGGSGSSSSNLSNVVALLNQQNKSNESKITIKPDMSRDPRAQRDPRSSARNHGGGVESRSSEQKDPRSRGAGGIRDPRLAPSLPDYRAARSSHPIAQGTGASCAEAAAPVVPHLTTLPSLPLPPLHDFKTEPKKPALIQQRNRKESSSSDSDKAPKTPTTTTAYHPLPYRLQAIAVSYPNYTSVLTTAAKADPKLVQNDPRLKRQLMNDPRLKKSPPQSLGNKGPTVNLGPVTCLARDHKSKLTVPTGRIMSPPLSVDSTTSMSPGPLSQKSVECNKMTEASQRVDVPTKTQMENDRKSAVVAESRHPDTIKQEHTSSVEPINKPTEVPVAAVFAKTELSSDDDDDDDDGGLIIAEEPEVMDTTVVKEEPPSAVPEEPPSTVPEEPPSAVPEEPPSTVPEEPPSTFTEEPSSTVSVAKEPLSGAKAPPSPVSVPVEPLCPVPVKDEPSSPIPDKPEPFAPVSEKTELSIPVPSKVEPSTPVSVNAEPPPLPVFQETKGKEGKKASAKKDNAKVKKESERKDKKQVDAKKQPKGKKAPASKHKPKTGGSGKRKSSMDYSSPLASDDADNSSSCRGYNRRPQLSRAAKSLPPIPPIRIAIKEKSRVEIVKPKPKVSSPPPSGGSTPMVNFDDDDDEGPVFDDACLKDIFKTIDPTASPFC